MVGEGITDKNHIRAGWQTEKQRRKQIPAVGRIGWSVEVRDKSESEGSKELGIEAKI